MRRPLEGGLQMQWGVTVGRYGMGDASAPVTMRMLAQACPALRLEYRAFNPFIETTWRHVPALYPYGGPRGTSGCTVLSALRGPGDYAAMVWLTTLTCGGCLSAAQLNLYCWYCCYNGVLMPYSLTTGFLSDRYPVHTDTSLF